MGLKRIDAELYVHLLQNNHATTAQLAFALRVDKRQIYRSAKRLEHKKMLTVTCGHPNFYSATPFGEVLDCAIQNSKEEAQRIEENRNRLLCEWKKLT